jgi:hypothetical protein
MWLKMLMPGELMFNLRLSLMIPQSIPVRGRTMSNYIFNGYECEDYDKHWGFTNFKDKRVLDVGADVGSTPSYFLSKGAVEVVAVSGKGEFDGLEANHIKYQWFGKVILVNMWLSSIFDFGDLISKYRPDILKCDLDPETRTVKLAEWYLFDCPDDILRLVPEYLIEWHDNESPECVNPNHMKDAWIKRFEDLGYQVQCEFHSGIVIWARKK